MKEDSFNKLKKIPGFKSSGLSISISTSNGEKPEIKVQGFGPQFQNMSREVSQNKEEKPVKIPKHGITEERIKSMAKLPREEAETSVRRFSNKIIYEINLPEVKDMKDIIINKLENSVEIKAFSKDRVYVKLIPLGLPLLSYNFKDETLTLEFKAR